MKHFKSAADLLEEAARSLQAAADMMRKIAKGQRANEKHIVDEWGDGPNQNFGSVMLPKDMLGDVGYELLEKARHTDELAREFIYRRTPAQS